MASFTTETDTEIVAHLFGANASDGLDNSLRRA